MNNLTILGNIGSKEELKATASGSSYINFSVAVPKRMDREKTNWFRCVAFGKTAENINKFFNKGQRIAIVGEMDFDTYTNKDGQTVNTSKVLVNSFSFCESTKQGGNAQTTVQNMGFDVNVVDEDMPF